MAHPKNTKFTPSWNLLPVSATLLRTHFVTALYLLILPGLLTTLGQILLRSVILPTGNIQLDSLQILGVICLITGTLWSLANLGPSIYFQLQAAEQDPEVSLISCYKGGLRYSLRLMILYLVVGLIFIGGLLILLVPGLIFIRRYFLAGFYLVTKNLTVRQAMEASSHDSKPAAGAIWGTLGVILAWALAITALSGLGIVGALIASVVSYVTVFLPALRYREISR